MTKRYIYILIVVVVFSLLIYHCSKGESIIAQVGDQQILKSEYIALLQRHFPRQENYQNVDANRKKEILEELISKKLKINAAYELGLNKNEEFITAINRYRESLINRRYYELIIVDRIVSQSDIENYLNNQKVNVNVSHILISFKGVNPEVGRSREEALILAQKIVQQLREGADFSDLARKHSDDPSVQSNEGNLGQFTWGQLVEPFQNAAWKMKIGEISEPVETRYGYHVIRLDDRQERTDYDPTQNEELILNIKKKIFSMRADSGRLLWLDHVNDLKDKKDFRVHTIPLNNLASMITEKLDKGNINPEIFTEEMLQTDLVSWEGGHFKLNDLIESHEDHFMSYISPLKQIHILRREVDSQAVKKLILDDAYKRNLQNDDFVLRNTQKMKEERLSQLAERNEIHNKINISDDEVYSYYLEHSDKFEKPAEIELWEIFLNDKQTAEKVLKMAQAGSDFEALARQCSKDSTLAAKGGYLGFRGKGVRGPISREAFERGSGKIGGPIRYRNGWTIYKTGESRESKIRPFEEVKNRAKNFLRQKRIEDQRKKWEQNLRSRFTIVINENELNRI
jgi:peptidyl-prolyl cis-trans isomerase C